MEFTTGKIELNHQFKQLAFQMTNHWNYHDFSDFFPETQMFSSNSQGDLTTVSGYENQSLPIWNNLNSLASDVVLAQVFCYILKSSHNHVHMIT